MSERTAIETGPSGLVRAIGPVALAASIVNITVGGGIFRLPAEVASSLGPAGPVAYLVCAVAFAFILVCLADAGSRVSATGGPYAYVEVAFGSLVGFLSGVLLWLVSTFAFAAVATVFTAGIGVMVPGLSSWTAQTAVLGVVLGVFAVINVLGVRQGARLNGIATIAKLLPLLLFIAAGAFSIRRENLVWPAVPAAATVARTSLVLVFAFSGVESALMPSGEVRDPARTVPRAIWLAMIGITVLYVALQVTAQGIVGPDLATSKAAPIADAAGKALGGTVRSVVLAGATISMLGYLGGMTLAVPRALYAFAQDGHLPRVLGRVHSRYRTPWVAIAVQAVLVLLLAASSTFERLAVLATVSVLLLYAGCCVASWELRRRRVTLAGQTSTVPLAGVAPYLALALIGWMLSGIHRDEWLAVGLCLLASGLLYAGARRYRGSTTRSVEGRETG